MAYESMSFAVGFSAEYGGIQNSLFQVQKKLDKTMEHLSTGKRINDMKDDEGGKAMSDVLSSWKKGTDETIYNLKEFISMTKVAEKALDDIQDILFEMKQTVDRLNGIEEGSERSAAQAQLRNLAMAINKIAEHTEYKGFKLFNMSDDGEDGKKAYLMHTLRGEPGEEIGAGVVSHSDRFIRYGAGAEDFISWDLGMDPRAQQLGMVVGAKIKLSSGSTALERLYLNGKNIKEIADQNGIDLTTREGKITAIRLALGENVKVEVVKVTSGGEYIYLQTPGDFVYGIKTTTGNTINQHVVKSTKLVTREREFTGNIDEESVTFRMEGVDQYATLNSSGATDEQNVYGADEDIVNKYTGVVGNRQHAIYFMNTEHNEENDAGVGVAEGKSSSLPDSAGAVEADEGLIDINVMTVENAATARVQIEAAINQISELRGVLAAMQHQAEALINQRMEESVATETQISHITDTDYAKELAEFTRQQIAQQAGINMLAQKRQAAQLVTQLLR